MRRLFLFLTLVSVAVAGLSACSSSGSGSSGGDSIKGLTVSGDFGSEPTVKVDGLDQTTNTTKTLIKGDGESVADGATIFADIYLANGSNGSKAFSTWDQKHPEALSLTAGGTLKPLTDAVVGSTSGSRVLLVAPASEFWPSGNQQAGISADDAVVWVIDVVGVIPTEPTGTKQSVPDNLPVPVVTDGKVTGVDFSNAPKKPSKKLQVVTLIKGDGPKVKAQDYVAFNYYGVVYGGTQAFDESYSRGPSGFQIGVNGLIKAWDKGLIGVPAGSRVLIIAPPSAAYGNQAQSNIPAGSTLVFVVDVLGIA